jgi:hypothetical protein
MLWSPADQRWCALTSLLSRVRSDPLGYRACDTATATSTAAPVRPIRTTPTSGSTISFYRAGGGEPHDRVPVDQSLPLGHVPRPPGCLPCRTPKPGRRAPLWVTRFCPRSFVHATVATVLRVAPGPAGSATDSDPSGRRYPSWLTAIAVQETKPKKCLLPAEGVGFEPTEAFTSRLFKSRAFVRSAIPPSVSQGSRRQAWTRNGQLDASSFTSDRSASTQSMALWVDASASRLMAGAAGPAAGYEPRNLTPASSA